MSVLKADWHWFELELAALAKMQQKADWYISKKSRMVLPCTLLLAPSEPPSANASSSSTHLSNPLLMLPLSANPRPLMLPVLAPPLAHPLLVFPFWSAFSVGPLQSSSLGRPLAVFMSCYLEQKYVQLHNAEKPCISGLSLSEYVTARAAHCSACSSPSLWKCFLG